MKRCILIPDWISNADWLTQHIQASDTLLAMSLPALVNCKKNFEQVLSVEDFVPYANIKKLAVQSREVNREFLKRGCQGALLDGYDWPEICWHMQQWFFRDVLLADALVSSLKSRGFEKIVWQGRLHPEKVLYLPTYDSVGAVMRFHFRENFDLVSLRTASRESVMSGFLRRIQSLSSFLYKRTIYRELEPTPCEVVAIWSINEWDRYTETMDNLCDEFGHQFQVWTLGARYPRRLRTWANSKGIKPFTIGYPDKVEQEIADFFTHQWEDWLAKGRWEFAKVAGYPVLAADELQEHFRFYFMNVWPRMAQWARETEQYLKIAAPRWVIGSSNYPPEWAFPHYVAEKLGMTSIALPHSYVQYGDGEIGASFLACRNRFERANFQNSFPDDSRILYCHNAGNKLSYQVQSGQLQNKDHRFTVVFLTADPDYPGSLMPTADRLAFLDTLTRIYSAPSDLSELTILVKSHPRGDISSLLRHLFPNPPSNITLINPSTSVNELLEKAWVVVLGNHYGGVVVQAILSGKPTIFLDPAKSFWPYTDKLGFAAGEVVEDMQSFWNLIRRLKDSPILYQELSERCQRFRTEYFQPVKETLVQRIRSLEMEQVSPVSSALIPPIPSV